MTVGATASGEPTAQIKQAQAKGKGSAAAVPSTAGRNSSSSDARPSTDSHRKPSAVESYWSRPLSSAAL